MRQPLKFFPYKIIPYKEKIRQKKFSDVTFLMRKDFPHQVKNILTRKKILTPKANDLVCSNLWSDYHKTSVALNLETKSYILVLLRNCFVRKRWLQIEIENKNHCHSVNFYFKAQYFTSKWRERNLLFIWDTRFRRRRRRKCVFLRCRRRREKFLYTFL